MSAKSDSPSWKLFCLDTTDAGTVKKESKKLVLTDDWDIKKYDVMKECITQKFIQSPLREKLLATGNEKIVEGNRWRDVYWGYDLNLEKGENNLGKLIMEFRTKLQNSLLTAKEYLEKRYQEDKEMWAKTPVDPAWKKWTVCVMEDFTNLDKL